MFQQEEESERGEPVAADLVVVENETAVRETKNGGKGRKRPSLAVSGRGRHAVKRAREPAVLEVITLYIIADPLMWDRYLSLGSLFLKIELEICSFFIII